MFHNVRAGLHRMSSLSSLHCQDGRGLARVRGHSHEESQDRHLLPDEHRDDRQSLPAWGLSLQHRALQQWADYLPRGDTSQVQYSTVQHSTTE